ncbi:hypothetical protein AaE_006774 [Aphanomyces astaci]|uniref:FAD/NAD(P)-binding domain-containing protein n=1 Tax=Aphanomyces astaci TaxID=112090 RepID=A0A6A5A497_APHAT|nr:hypothetical protein AaE_006774 [Aphanomyces astaci]
MMMPPPSNIVVVGGGYIGVQFAQELAKHLTPSQASITLIEKNDFTFHCVGVPRALVDPSFVKKLFIPLDHALPSTATILRGIVDKIDGVKDAFREQLTAKLAKLNVHVVLGERLVHDSEPPASAVVTTDRGTSIDADMQLLCAGMLPNVDLIRRLDPTLLSIRSRGIRVNGACQIDDRRYSHVFVVGDASDHPTPKLAYVGAFQAKHVAAQLAKVVVSSTTSSSSSRKEVVLEPANPWRGQVPVLGGIVVGDVVVRFIKGNDYFASTFLDQWHTTEDGAAIPPKKRSGGWAVLVVAVAVAAWYYSKS